MQISINTIKRSIHLIYYKLKFPNTPILLFKTWINKLTYLGPYAIKDIYSTVRSIEDNKIKGLFIEAGCALGGSGIVISASKEKDRRFHIYDTFGMIPEPNESDKKDVHDRYKDIISGKSKGIGGELYYGYRENLLSEVKNNFVKFKQNPFENNISFIEGKFEDTMNLNTPIAFAHIDCDWYDSVTKCLCEISPNLVSGGIMIIDDYNAWSGCKNAVDDFFADKKSEFKFINKTKLHIQKK